MSSSVSPAKDISVLNPYSLSVGGSIVVKAVRGGMDPFPERSKDEKDSEAPIYGKVLVGNEKT
jgi:hypothetical protein